MLYMQMDNYDLPSAFISQADGKYLVGLAEGQRKLTVSATSGSVDNPTSGEMSDFSSWGVTPELTLKPDLTAPAATSSRPRPAAATPRRVVRRCPPPSSPVPCPW